MAGIDPISNVAGAAEGIIGSIGNVLERFIPDATKRAEAAAALEMELAKQQGEQNQGQIEINKVEAGSTNLFISGWRPFVGWTLGAGFAWAFIIGPVFAMFARVWLKEYTLPVLDTGSLTTMLLAMLGLGGLHSFDKYNGTTAPAQPVITTKEIRKALPVK